MGDLRHNHQHEQHELPPHDPIEHGLEPGGGHPVEQPPEHGPVIEPLLEPPEIGSVGPAVLPTGGRASGLAEIPVNADVRAFFAELPPEMQQAVLRQMDLRDVLAMALTSKETRSLVDVLIGDYLRHGRIVDRANNAFVEGLFDERHVLEQIAEGLREGVLFLNSGKVEEATDALTDLSADAFDVWLSIHESRVRQWLASIDPQSPLTLDHAIMLSMFGKSPPLNLQRAVDLVIAEISRGNISPDQQHSVPAPGQPVDRQQAFEVLIGLMKGTHSLKSER